MITLVRYERVFNLGAYESERLTVEATVADGDYITAFDEARAAVETQHARFEGARHPQPEAPAQRPPPKTAAEAQQRFFARYSETIGGASWASVQRYLSSRAPMPTTVEGWVAAAEAVKARPRTLPEGWDDQPGQVSDKAQLPV